VRDQGAVSSGLFFFFFFRAARLTLEAYAKLEEVRGAMVVEYYSAANITKRGNPWIFTDQPAERDGGPRPRSFSFFFFFFLKYSRSSGIKQADIPPVKTDWGRGSVTAFRRHLKNPAPRRGGECMEQSATDMNAQDTKVKRARPSTLLQTTSVRADARSCSSRRRSSGYRKVITTGGSSSPSQLISRRARRPKAVHILFVHELVTEAMQDGKLARPSSTEWRHDLPTRSKG